MSQPEPQRSIIYQCAWLYYVQGAKQETIARQLAISRPTVGLYLRKARAIGMVRISMDSAYFADHFLAQALRTGLGLDSVYVVPAISGNTLEDVVTTLWHVLEPLLAGTSSLGVAWGESLYAFATALPRSHYPALHVMQLCGNMAGTPYRTLPDTSTFRIARQLGAEAHNLYAPMILSSPEMARAMLHEPVVAEHFKALRNCDIAIFSPGTCTVDSHIVSSGAISKIECQQLRQQGARAVVCGRLIDEHGEPLVEFNQRVVAVELAALKKIPDRFMIASGSSKADAVAAAIRGGFLTHLVVDVPIAEQLMATFDLSFPANEASA